MKKFIIALSLFSLISCTDNNMARNYGGTEKIKLKENEVLLNMTWKEMDLWILTRDTITGTEYFRESSSFGIWEGQIIVE